jgi:superfamily II DNA helicase RecQ
MVGNGDRVVAQGDGFDRGERGEGGRTGRDGKDSDAMMPSTDRDIIGVTSLWKTLKSICLSVSNLRVHRFHTHTHSMDSERWHAHVQSSAGFRNATQCRDDRQ